MLWKAQILQEAQTLPGVRIFPEAWTLPGTQAAVKTTQARLRMRTAAFREMSATMWMRIRMESVIPAEIIAAEHMRDITAIIMAVPAEITHLQECMETAHIPEQAEAARMTAPAGIPHLPGTGEIVHIPEKLEITDITATTERDTEVDAMECTAGKRVTANEK